MKRIVGFMLIVGFFLTTFTGHGQTQQTDYQVWLTTFLTGLNDLPLTPGPNDWNELNTLLALKPRRNTGQYYSVWFQSSFLPFLKETGTLLDAMKAEKLRYILAARPDKEGSSGAFQEYFKEFLIFVDQILPIMEDSEKVLLAAFKEVAPESSATDFALWLNTVNALKEEYGPNFSDTEDLILKVLAELQPDTEVINSGNLTVPAATLLKIKNLISTGQPHLAIREIDTLLSGK